MKITNNFNIQKPEINKVRATPIPNPQSPVPNPQSPIPSPQSPVPNPRKLDNKQRDRGERILK